jgi:hypothetical protein
LAATNNGSKYGLKAAKPKDGSKWIKSIIAAKPKDQYILQNQTAAWIDM